MLRLIYGMAKSGKTGMVMREINSLALSGARDIKLIVPEQYSHEAERELCAACGDSMSLHAEVLSFTRLSRRICDMLGSSRRFMSASARALVLARALDAVGARLKVFAAARRSDDMQRALLAAVTELKLANVTPERLEEEAQRGSEPLYDKLGDLAVILGAYDAMAQRGELDPADRLTALARSIDGAPQLELGDYFIDGFTDFTAAEREVIRSLARRCRSLTLCLTLDSPSGGSEVFDSPRRTAAWFGRLASERGEQLETVHAEREPSSPAAVLSRWLFDYTGEKFEADGRVVLKVCSDIESECAAAAARARSLAMSGARWRDIAVAVRGFESCRAALTQAFAEFGVPLYIAARSDVMQKPLPLMISSALEAVCGGFEYEDMFACFKTGLAGLSTDETDKLENYCITWSVRGTMWLREWTMHPDGYSARFDDDARARLDEINALRARAIAPFAELYERSRTETTAAGQAAALAGFFEGIKLPESLERRAAALTERGDAASAAEYSQLCDMAVDSLEQAAAALGGAEMTLEEFGRLYRLMLSQSDVGTIPVSLDSVSAGEMDRMRRRNIKHLIIIGASDQRIPQVSEPGGVFSADERRVLHELGLDLGTTADMELAREFNLIYNCVSLPSESIYMSYSPHGADGAEARPSFVMLRAQALFGLEIDRADMDLARICAPEPAWLLAAEALRSPGRVRDSALEYFRKAGAARRLDDLRAAASAMRGRLSPEAVRSLYGEKIRLSASRADSFASCRFKFFMQFGLKAKPRRAAGFNPPEMGSFMHYVLENVARDISRDGPFRLAKRERVDELCGEYIGRYVHEELGDMREKSKRFIYLFQRLSESVRSVVWDMVEELSRSDFAPLDFELSFSPDGAGAVEIDESAELTGVADRVDGWVSGGKLYLRVMDYKTGKKSFDLSDVLYGRDLQMLMYLFALADRGRARYGMEIIPAGVLYVPAREPMVAADGDLDDGEIASLKAKERRRSGIVLDDPAVIEAMEHGDDTRYIPVTFKKGVPSGDALVSAEQLGCVSRYVELTLRDLARELRHGSIDADPYYRSQQENACLWCDYFDACYFDPNRDRRNYATRLRPARALELMAEKEARDGD